VTESHIGAVPVSEAKEIVMCLEKLASEVACLKQSLGKDDLGMPNAIIFQRLIKIADRQFPVCLFMEWKRLIAGKLAELVIKAVDVLIERVDERLRIDAHPAAISKSAGLEMEMGPCAGSRVS
jgi:hypothetical protein